MSESETLDRLASELSLEERKELLDKLNVHSGLSRSLLYEEKHYAVFALPEKKTYTQLPWYVRLKYLIISIFSGIPQKQVFERRQIVRLGKIINRRAPGYYDYRQDLLLPNLREKFMQLKNAARFFYNTLDQSINRDKGVFYAFLASLEMGDIHNRLLRGTNITELAAENPSLQEGELRQMALNNVEQDVSLITENEKSRMYANVRSLHYLKALSTFSFDRIILSFTPNPVGGAFICKGIVVEAPLVLLQNVLFSLKQVPSMALLESLFIFTLQEQREEVSVDINIGMEHLLSMAEDALMIIRDFNREVPLMLILRCISRDMGLMPQDIGGGEDWFVAYREYWRRQVEERLNEYKRTCRHNELVNILHQFFKRGTLETLHHVVSPYNPDGFPLPEALPLSCLMTFYSNVFMPDINQIFRTILIEGDFYQVESRTRFTEICNEFTQFENTIREFEFQLSPEGKYGSPYFSPDLESMPAPIRRRKYQRALNEASTEAQGIITTVKQTMAEMIRILEALIRKDADGNYDALVNITKIASKNPGFIHGIGNAMRQFQQILQFLDAIDMLETGKEKAG
ncbi:MAG: DUF5312 domain-containing protein [Spirochaetaceae bacterium]|jgi:hypothetical protein|nr:DUF5312 domain-containing protein [Spirochaetaceae bacterium]